MPEEDSAPPATNDPDTFLRGIAAAPDLSHPGAHAPPTTSRFRIHRKLGEGGMGVVYEAFDEERRHPVALKTLRHFTGDALARFKKEFRALRGLCHPNLVFLHDLYNENDQWFFTMELLDGVDFVRHVRGTASTIHYASTLLDSPASGVDVTTASGASAQGEQRFIPFDEQRLREALRQLLEGLAVLHTAAKVHRDVKPSNVLVTREGRVVLLDFGLIAEAWSGEKSATSGIVGTPAYMAPEQAASREIGPAADMYSVGVMLYEAMTGRLPVQGSPLYVLLEKQKAEPPPPSSVVPGLPSDLNELCVALLGSDPTQRPLARESLSRISPSKPCAALSDGGAAATDAFVGRTAELAALRRAYDDTQQNHLVTVLVCGESGIGKSRTVQKLARDILKNNPDAMLLEARCYEREAIPYKTLDGIADALGQQLSRMSTDASAALLPVRSAALGCVFPVLQRVPQIASELSAGPPAMEPHELRQRAFRAMRELLERIALRRPTVVIIDDLQWADEDGLRALAEVFREPEPPPLLLIGTVRTGPSALLQRLPSIFPGDVRVLHLEAMQPPEARELAASVLRQLERPDADPEKIAGEAGGHPFFIEELARHVALGLSMNDGVLLDEALRSRVARLEPGARAIVEVVAVAGQPTPHQVVARAARLDAKEFERHAATLRALNLVRSGGGRWTDRVEPYHDRVREAVAARLSREETRTAHEALAQSLANSDFADDEALARHWREAGNSARAAAHARHAGDRARRALAFDRAAQWYSEALDLLAPEDPSAFDLRVRLGGALGDAGRGALAAPHLERAANEAPPAEALELRRRAAEQLLRSGHVDRGRELLQSVLDATGMPVPKTAFGLLVVLLANRLRLSLVSWRLKDGDAAGASPPEATRIDTCLTMAMAFILVDYLVGAIFATRALLLAIRAGDAERTARAIGFEVAFSAGVGGRRVWRRAETMLLRGEALVARGASEVADSFVAAGWAAALQGVGRHREAVVQLERVLQMMRGGAAGLVMEASSMRVLLLTSLAFLGRYRALRAMQEEALRDALSRGDVFSSVLMRVGQAGLVWLMRDDPQLAASQAAEAMDAWSKRGFHMEHYLALVGRIQVRLYMGDAEGAFVLAEELHKELARSLLRRIQSFRVGALFTRGASALAVAACAPETRSRMIRIARRAARKIAHEDMSWLHPFGTALQAGVALQSGRREEALSYLDDTARGYAAHELFGYANAARYVGAALRGDVASETEALAYFENEGARAPQRMARMLIPGCAV